MTSLSSDLSTNLPRIPGELFSRCTCVLLPPRSRVPANLDLWLPLNVQSCKYHLLADAFNELFLKISVPLENVPSWENDLFL